MICDYLTMQFTEITTAVSLQLSSY